MTSVSECPAWRAEWRPVWADTGEPALHGIDPATGADEAWKVPAWID